MHAKGKPLAKESNLEVIAKQTAGFSGADLANLINEAAILAARRNLKEIGTKELEDSIDRVIAGPERKGRIISQKEKENTAYHEAGHALVAKMLPNATRCTRFLLWQEEWEGWTKLLPTKIDRNYTRSQFEDLLAVMLGGTDR